MYVNGKKVLEKIKASSMGISELSEELGYSKSYLSKRLTENDLRKSNWAVLAAILKLSQEEIDDCESNEIIKQPNNPYCFEILRDELEEIKNDLHEQNEHLKNIGIILQNIAEEWSK